MPLHKVISGAQTGVDRAALYAARYHGIPTGGFMPRGFLAPDGCHPDFARVFGVVALESADYPARTRANVEAADATLLLTTGDTTGTACTLNAIQRHNNLCLPVTIGVNEEGHLISRHSMTRLDQPDAIKAYADDITRLLEPFPEGVLNVAGTRNAYMEQIVTKWLEDVFREVLRAQAKEAAQDSTQAQEGAAARI